MTHSAIGGAPMPAPLVKVTDDGSRHAWNWPTPEPIAWIQRSFGATVAISSGASSERMTSHRANAAACSGVSGGSPAWVAAPSGSCSRRNALVMADLERDGHQLDLWMDRLQPREVGDAGHRWIRNVYDEWIGHCAPWLTSRQRLWR